MTEMMYQSAMRMHCKHSADCEDRSVLDLVFPIDGMRLRAIKGEYTTSHRKQIQSQFRDYRNGKAEIRVSHQYVVTEH